MLDMLEELKPILKQDHIICYLKRTRFISRNEYNMSKTKTEIISHSSKFKFSLMFFSNS